MQPWRDRARDERHHHADHDLTPQRARMQRLAQRRPVVCHLAKRTAARARSASAPVATPARAVTREPRCSSANPCNTSKPHGKHVNAMGEWGAPRARVRGATRQKRAWGAREFAIRRAPRLRSQLTHARSVASQKAMTRFLAEASHPGGLPAPRIFALRDAMYRPIPAIPYVTTKRQLLADQP